MKPRLHVRRTGKLFPHAAVRVRVKIRARVEVRVRVSVSYIMRIWRWEEFFKCDKFSTTPSLLSDVVKPNIKKIKACFDFVR